MAYVTGLNTPETIPEIEQFEKFRFKSCFLFMSEFLVNFIKTDTKADCGKGCKFNQYPNTVCPCDLQQMCSPP